jgi:hypothetical protein
MPSTPSPADSRPGASRASTARGWWRDAGTTDGIDRAGKIIEHPGRPGDHQICGRVHDDPVMHHQVAMKAGDDRSDVGTQRHAGVPDPAREQKAEAER